MSCLTALTHTQTWFLGLVHHHVQILASLCIMMGRFLLFCLTFASVQNIYMQNRPLIKQIAFMTVAHGMIPSELINSRKDVREEISSHSA